MQTVDLNEKDVKEIIRELLKENKNLIVEIDGSNPINTERLMEEIRIEEGDITLSGIAKLMETDHI